MDAYPATVAARDRFVLDRRPRRARHDPWRYQQLLVEDERAADRTISRTATVFLTGRECPWRCVMCDLWRFTNEEDTPEGAVAAQVGAARADLAARGEPIRQMKLYNAGNFFDPRAVPTSDYDGVAVQLAGLDRVIVESHPALVGERVDRFLDALDRQASVQRRVRLEVAMGLETARPEALEKLHKRMTVETFAAAAAALARRAIDLRVFLLISPPFIAASEQLPWLLRSVAVAFACHASVVALVPTRPGNGAIDALSAHGHFAPPRLEDIEDTFAAALHQCAGPRRRIFVDLWDLERFTDCRDCLASRRARLHAMNLEQRVLPAALCARCGRGTAS
jgi:radical SAM enzyme (TIGR01210 family)